jgi:hypothetical protein
MRLGKRSTRIRAGGRRQLIAPALGTLLAGFAAVLYASAVRVPDAQAQRAAPATVGPGRIVCNASFCEMGSSARPNERIRVIVSNLPQDDIHRLRKCTGVAKPCIVKVEGVEQGDTLKVLASSIQWQE